MIDINEIQVFIVYNKAKCLKTSSTEHRALSSLVCVTLKGISSKFGVSEGIRISFCFYD